MGKQVQNNLEVQLVAEIHKHKDGFYYVTNQPRNHLGKVMGEYIPIGRSLIYPKKWGRKEGTLLLLNHRIQDLETTISSLSEELEGLKKAKEEAETWE